MALSRLSSDRLTQYMLLGPLLLLAYGSVMMCYGDLVADSAERLMSCLSNAMMVPAANGRRSRMFLWSLPTGSNGTESMLLPRAGMTVPCKTALLSPWTRMKQSHSRSSSDPLVPPRRCTALTPPRISRVRWNSRALAPLSTQPLISRCNASDTLVAFMTSRTIAYVMTPAVSGMVLRCLMNTDPSAVYIFPARAVCPRSVGVVAGGGTRVAFGALVALAGVAFGVGVGFVVALLFAGGGARVATVFVLC